MIKRYKSKKPNETLSSIFTLLKNMGLTIQRAPVNNVEGFYSTILTVQDTSLSVNGKGSQEDYAIASAYGELIERLLTNVLVRFQCRFSEEITFLDKNLILKDNIDIESLNNSFQLNLTEEQYMLFQKYFFDNIDNGIICEAYKSLLDNTGILLPVSIVDAFYNTNGIAYGNDYSEASVQALSEIFERYVNREILDKKLSLPRITDWKNRISVELKDKILRLLQKENLKLEVLDCTLGDKFPVTGIIVTNAEQKYFVKFGAHFSFEISLERCFTELFQGRAAEGDFWKARIFEDNEEFRIANMEATMKDGNGYYPTEFFIPKEAEDICKFSFGQSNEEAYNVFLDILKSLSSRIYFKDYTVGEHHVVRYVIPSISNIVLNSDALLLKYRRTIYHSETLLNYLYLSVDERECFINYLKNRQVAFGQPLFSLAKYPVKTPAALNYITYEYLLGIHKLFKGDYEDITSLFNHHPAIEKNAEKLISFIMNNDTSDILPQLIEKLLFYPKQKGNFLMIGDKNISQVESMTKVYKKLQNYMSDTGYKGTDVLLINMPFDAIDKPSLGIALLVSAAKSQGIDIKALYPKFQFAEKIGHDKYNFMCNYTEPSEMPGEYIFSKVVFGDFCGNEYIEKILGKDLVRLKNTNLMLKKFGINEPFEVVLNSLIDTARVFVEEIAEQIISKKPKIVACSSMFQQNCASLALLKVVKEKNPDIITIMGGANCEGELGVGIVEAFNWVDYVISGEGDFAFPQLCKMILSKDTIVENLLPTGVLTGNRIKHLDKKSLIASVPIDDLQCPDYDDYFVALDEYKYKDRISPMLLIESSRGCWWGEKKSRRCRFCGLNGSNAHYRSKESEKVINELKYLSDRHSVKRFFFSDNILNMNYFESLLPKLASNKLDPYYLHVETKANLNEQHIIKLKNAGVRWIQPGIENLHDESLKALGKGTTAINNVQLLKITQKYKINTIWNYLTGIPNEQKHWYDEVCEWIPLISHLQPPSGIFKLRFDRFSLFQQEPEKFNITIKANMVYKYIYPISETLINKICRFYISDNRNSLEDGSDKQLYNSIYEWMGHYYSSRKPRLLMNIEGNITYIKDTRPCAVKNDIILENHEHYVYAACKKIVAIKDMQDKVLEKFNIQLDEEQVEEALNGLLDKKLILKIHNFVLALAISIS